MDAFESGSGIGGKELSVLISGTGCVLILLCAIWVLISAYRGWAKGRVGSDVFSIVAVKTLVLVLLFFWVFLS